MTPLWIFIALLSFSSSLIIPTPFESSTPRATKRSYVCPPKFIRQGHRCYYFSKEAVTWQDALFHCRDMHSNLAIIKNKNQDKLIRNFLSMKTLDPLERWLAAVYDWKKMEWKWAASGKPITFNSFPKEASTLDPETLRWHCIILDPTRQYMWNSKPCVEMKQYICQTRLKTVTNRDKKKLQRQYKTDKDNKLNEIPVPLINEGTNDTNALKYHIPITYHFEINDELSDNALFAYKSPEMQKKSRKMNRKNRKRNPQRLRPVRLANGTIIEKPNRRLHRKRLNKNDKDMGETYFDQEY